MFQCQLFALVLSVSTLIKVVEAAPETVQLHAGTKNSRELASSGQQFASSMTHRIPLQPGVVAGTIQSSTGILNIKSDSEAGAKDVETETIAHDINSKVNQLEHLVQNIMQDDVQYTEQRKVDLQHDVQLAAEVTQRYEAENKKLAQSIESLRHDNLNLEQRAIRLRTANAKIVRELYSMQSNARDVMANFSEVAQEERAKDDVKNAITLVRDTQGDMPSEEMMKSITESSALPQPVISEPEKMAAPQSVIVAPQHVAMRPSKIVNTARPALARQPVVEQQPVVAQQSVVTQQDHIQDLVSKIRSKVKQANQSPELPPITVQMDNHGQYQYDWSPEGMSALQTSQLGRQGTYESNTQTVQSQEDAPAQVGDSPQNKNSDTAESWDDAWDDDQQSNVGMSFLVTSRHHVRGWSHHALKDPAISRVKALRAELGITNQRQSPGQRLIANLRGLMQVAGRLNRIEEQKEDQSELDVADALAPYAAHHQQLKAERQRLNNVKASLVKVNLSLKTLVHRLQGVHNRLKGQLQSVRDSLSRIDSLTDV